MRWKARRLARLRGGGKRLRGAGRWGSIAGMILALALSLAVQSSPAAARGVPVSSVPVPPVSVPTPRPAVDRGKSPSPGDAAAGDWRAIAPDDLLVMTLAGGRSVLIRLAGAYAREHVANIRRLARAHYWDGTSVYRVQDNWVTQWGGQPDDPPNDAGNKPLPDGVVKVPAAEYDLPAGIAAAQPLGRDAYADTSGITADGWAMAGGGGGGAPAWLAHCYGTIGVARDAAPDTGSGSELFMPIGGSARRLDRNYTIVGRVIDGARFLSGLPRSTAPNGVYPAAGGERVAIVSVRLASDLPEGERPHFEYRAADNPRFAAAIQARRHPAGMIATGGPDACDVPLPTRRVPPPAGS